MEPINSLVLMTVAWSILCVYLAVFYLILFFQMSERKEYFFESLLALCTGAYVFSHVWLSVSFPTPESEKAIHIGLAFLFLANPAFLSFSYIFCGKQVNRFVRFNYVYGIMGFALSASGNLHEPDPLIRTFQWADWVVFTYRDFPLNSAGIVMLLTMWLFFLNGCILIVKNARVNQYSRLLVPGVFINCAAVTHDMFVMAFHLNSIYLFDHSAVAALLSLSFVLTSRFMDTKKELRKTTQALAENFYKLNLAQKEMKRQKKHAAEGELSAMVAHEVRNPLSIIQNALVSFVRTSSKERRKVLADIIQEETLKLIGIRKELQIVGAPMEIVCTKFQIDQFIEQSVDAAKEHVQPQREIIVEVQNDHASNHIDGDEKWLHHAMVNIIENAFEAMPRGGKIKIYVSNEQELDQDYTVFKVEDTGEGMDEETLDKVLQPFFTTRGTGTGLGLAIVDRIIQAHRGKMNIESEKGAGSQFTVVLPTDSLSKDYDAVVHHSVGSIS